MCWGGGGRGEEEHVKIVHMGKGKPPSVAVCSLVHDFDHLLERRGAIQPGGLAVPLTGFSKAEAVS